MDKDKLRDMVRYMIKCCYWYYVMAHPVEADQTYDKMLHALEHFEGGEPISDISPTQMIWGDCAAQYPSWAMEEPTSQERESAYDLLSIYTEEL
jgi:NAD-dependent DNA ligase